MATSFSSLLPLTFVFLLIFIITKSTPSSATKDLVESVCKNTTNYTFCMEALYTDPPLTDGVELSVYVFALGTRNASKTLKYVDILLKGGDVNTNKTNGPKLYLSHIKNCKKDYEKALVQLRQASNDINVELYYNLCGRAKYGVHAAQKCGSEFQTVDHLLTEMNRVMDGISHICMVVSQLYVPTPCKR